MRRIYNIRLRWAVIMFAVGWFSMILAAPGMAEVERWSLLADSVFQHFGTDNGLPHPIVTALAEDGDGFLWVGTEDGLARWDGYRFRSYKPDTAQPDSLPDNFIQCLHTDMHKRLWIGTNAGGLARYDREDDRFKTYAAGPQGIADVSVWSIADDGAGGLWVGTDGGLDHLDPSSGAITHLRHAADDQGGLPDNHIRALLRDRRGTLWIGTRRGLVRRDTETGALIFVPVPAPKGPAPIVRALFEDSGGRIWVATHDEGAYVIEPGKSAAHAVRDASSADGLLEVAPVYAVAESAPGEVWLGTFDRGIVAIDTATWRSRRIRHDPARPTSLSHNTVWALHRDRAGLVWVGTTASLNLHDPNQRGFLTIFGGTGRPDGVSDVDVKSILAAPGGRVWLGSGDNGVDILDPRGVLAAAVRPDPAHPGTALPRTVVEALAVAANGDVYLGTAQGLYRTDSTGGHVTPVLLSKQYPDIHVNTLLVEGEALWAGSTVQGLWRLDVRDNTARRYGEGQLTDQRVRVIAPMAGGALWLGTRNGLNRFDPVSEKAERILANARDPQSLSAGFVSTLLTDGLGRLWVGTQGGGIDVLEGRDAQGRPHFRRVGLAQGLPNANVDTLLADRTGKIWASTDDGIVAIDPLDFAIRAYHRAEGVAIRDYWVNSGAVTQEGELLFGGASGLTVVRPAQVTDWTYRPPVVITDILLGGKSVPAGPFNHPDVLRRLTVAADANSFAVEFAALDFSAPERNRYAFRLDGFDKGWIDSDSTRRLAHYTNLPPGDYTLWMRGSNREGVWSEAALEVPVRVLPAWYQTWWFNLVASLAACLAVAAVVQARTMALRRRQDELARQVAERTVELLETQRQLEQIAYMDVLTSLPNRRMFAEDLRKLIASASRRRARFALLLLDLDRFKQVNDTLGHDFGDALLIASAARLKAAIRNSDVVARFGGDEFAILLTESNDYAGVELACRRIVDSFVAPVQLDGHLIAVGVSIGIAIFPLHASGAEELAKCADVALYAAKRAGGNTWVWYGANAHDA